MIHKDRLVFQNGIFANEAQGDFENAVRVIVLNVLLYLPVVLTNALKDELKKHNNQGLKYFNKLNCNILRLILI